MSDETSTGAAGAPGRFIVKVLPLDVDLVVRLGESVMAAAQRLGYYWPTRCRGQALCTACLFEVVAGPESFSSVEPLEHSALSSVSGAPAKQTGRLRLGCQARPLDAATILKRGVKLADPPQRSTGFFA
jgi:2Fe-2S ferredoxin